MSFWGIPLYEKSGNAKLKINTFCNTNDKGDLGVNGLVDSIYFVRNYEEENNQKQNTCSSGRRNINHTGIGTSSSNGLIVSTHRDQADIRDERICHLFHSVENRASKDFSTALTRLYTSHHICSILNGVLRMKSALKCKKVNMESDRIGACFPKPCVMT